MHLIVNGKRVKKKKTSVRKCNDSNPTWNEAFTFNLSQSNLQNAAIEVIYCTSSHLIAFKYFQYLNKY